MFGKFFNKHRKNKPQFDFLINYKNKDKYFLRTNHWDWLNEKEIYLPMKKDDKPTMVTMDFWSQEIFLDATGQIAVTELIDLACHQYEKSKMDIPEEIDKILIEALENLVFELKVVEFSDVKKNLPKEIELPISKQV